MKFYTKSQAMPDEDRDEGKRSSILLKQILMRLNLVVFIIGLAFLNVSAEVNAQTVTLKAESSSLKTVFDAINKQTGYFFWYEEGLLNKTSNVSLDLKDATLEESLAACLKNQNLEYTINDKTIVVKHKEKSFLNKVISYLAATDVRGRVINEREEPLVGATVTVKGTNRSVVIGKDGGFYIQNLEDDAILLISFVGYVTQEVSFASLQKTSLIILRQDIGNLDQVQVTAYGTTTKRLNAGNITTITSKDIEKNPVNNVFEALRANVPGLFIQQTTGQPGGAFNVRMRGASNLSTNGTTEPLVIVDGVRYPSGALDLYQNTQWGTGSFLSGGSGLNYINPNDIESIDVLKDINATAIYGSSGAYGVIIITTKKAKSGEPAFNANISTGVTVLGTPTPLLNTEQYLMLRREALANDKLEVPTSNNDLNGVWPEERYTDFRKLYLGESASTTKANLSYNGGGQYTSFLIGGDLQDMGNIQRHKGANRDLGVKLSLNTRLPNDKLQLSISGKYLSSKNTMVPLDFSSSIRTPPNSPNPFNPDGSLNWEEIGTDVNSSAAAGNFNRLYENLTDNLTSNLTLIYKPVGKVTLRTIVGYTSLNGTESIGYPSTVFHPEQTDIASKTVGVFSAYTNRTLTISPYGEYQTTIAKKGNISFKIGGEVNRRLRRSNSLTGTGFASDGLIANPAVGNSIKSTYNLIEYRSIGMYGLINFVWDNKYILDINTRRDGSTRFGPGRRFGNFYSAAAAWIFSEESLIKDNLTWFSYGKLRASSGVVGGDGIGDFQYLNIYQTLSGQYGGIGSLAPSNLTNPNLNWERNKKSEVAIELGFFNNRINTNISYYHEEAGNQLVDQALPYTTGFGGQVVNSDALIRSIGTEIELKTLNIRSKNFSWSSSLNVSLPKSKILRLPTQRNPRSNFVLNQSSNGVRVYKYNGVNPETGYYSFTKANGETSDYTSGLVNDDKTEFIDLSPKFFGGLQNSVSYKQVSLDFTFSFTKRIAKNILGQNMNPFGMYGANGSTVWLDRWQKPGDVTQVPKLSTSFDHMFRHWLFVESTGAYEDATYARLQNVALNYNLSQEFCQKMHLKNMSISLKGQNLLTLSKFKGVDPENLDISKIPPLKIFTAGLNITF